MFIKDRDCVYEEMASGSFRAFKGYIHDLMIIESRWKTGQIAAENRHPHRQCVYIIKGTFEATVNGETEIVEEGDCFYVEANQPHGWTALTDGRVIEVFTPYREDLLNA